MRSSGDGDLGSEHGNYRWVLFRPEELSRMLCGDALVVGSAVFPARSRFGGARTSGSNPSMHPVAVVEVQELEGARAVTPS